MNLQDIINEAKNLGSYFITITTRDKTKIENDLKHYVFRQEFDVADVIPSLDNCVNQLGVKLEKPVEVIVPPPVVEEKLPLRIAILTHFNRMPQSYSPARAVRNQIKILREHGHKVVFFTQENSKLTDEDLGCEVRHLIPSFKRIKMVVNEEAKNKFIQVLKEQLTGQFDIAITHDFFLQDTVTYSEAIRECGVPIQWLHFARSGIGHNMTFAMPNARFVYLNKSEVGNFAKAIKVPPEQCRTVFNEKEIQYMFNFHPVTRMIINKFKLYNRDIIMTYPMCSTRIAAKGLRDVIRIFVELKKLGNKVALIIPNANGRRRVDDLKREQQLAKDYGLNEDEFIFTSLLADENYKIESELPNIVCAELMQISNLFLFASRAEVGPNVLLEAGITKNLIVVNEDLPLMYDFVNKNAVLSYPFTSNHSLHYKGRTEENYKELAKQIVIRLREDWADRQFRFTWRQHNAEAIYKMLESVLYEDFKNK
jgi:glycosyltransferase involved in cell wall biosynthesis